MRLALFRRIGLTSIYIAIWGLCVALIQAQPVPPTRSVVVFESSPGIKRLVDVKEFTVVGIFPDCPFFHCHAGNGSFVTALDGTQIPDPAPNACGYGILGLKPVRIVFDLAIPDSDFDGIPDAREEELGLDSNNPDSDGDGVLDGDEDFDNDALSNADEIVRFQTAPTDDDSDNNGVLDSVDVVLASTAKDFTKIPVIVNILKNSGVSVAHATDAITKANIILKKAKIMLVLARPVKVLTDNDGDDGTGGGTAGDGNLTEREGDKVLTAGGQEINSLLPGGKGVKVTFADDVWVGSTTPAWSIHRNPTIVTQQRASTDLTGATIAHEFGHVFTLEHPQDDPAMTPEDKTGSIMNPSNAGRDDFVNSGDADKGLENVEITPGQKAQIDTDGVHRMVGFQGTMSSPAVKREYQFGSVTDDRGDQSGGAPDHFDLNWIAMSSETGSDSIEVLLTLGGLFPDSGQVDATYHLLFDSDANPGTGFPVAGFSGIDKEIQIHVRGDASMEPLRMFGLIMDYEDFTLSLLAPEPVLLVGTRESGLNVPALPFEHQFELSISKDALVFPVSESGTHRDRGLRES